MLSGRKAFEKKSGAEMMAAILKEEPPAFEVSRAIPPSLEKIVQHCLEKDPALRFQSAQDIAFDLRSLSTLSGTHAARALKLRRRSKWVVPTATLLVGLVRGHTRQWQPSAGEKCMPQAQSFPEAKLQKTPH